MTMTAALWADDLEPQHGHQYRVEIADWWCDECDTVTDFCQQINPS